MDSNVMSHHFGGKRATRKSVYFVTRIAKFAIVLSSKSDESRHFIVDDAFKGGYFSVKYKLEFILCTTS